MKALTVRQPWATAIGCCPNRGARPFGSPWAQPDQWHLCLADARPLEQPILCKGQLGLWTPPAEVLKQLQAVV